MHKQFAIALLLAGTSLRAQQVIRVRVSDPMQHPIAGATIRSGTMAGIANDSGQAVLPVAATGRVELRITAAGFAEARLAVTLPDTSWRPVVLQPREQELEGVTILSSTRSNQRMENAPMKVEVLGREDMEEEGGIRPANIASIIGDVSGIQIQQSQPTTGNSNVRIQGLEGRYTQILRDGMPLFDGFSGGFSIMQIPPLDLKQIELVKGAASTLYGGGAIGGLINLISKRPTTQQEGLVLLNQTSLKESNVNTYVAKRYDKVGYTFFGGHTYQDAVDVNKDGLSDVPHLNTTVLHPRLFVYPGSKTTIALGYTATLETRKGGDMEVLRNNKSPLHQYFENNNNQRHTTDLLVEQYLAGGKKLELKGSYSNFTRGIAANTYNFNGRQQNYYGEASIFVPAKAFSFVGGINTVGDRFAPQPVANPIAAARIQAFSNNTAGAFAQATLRLNATTIEAGLRGDHHFTYGNFVLPRIAFIHHINQHWGVRAGAGAGYKAPNPLAPQIQDFDIVAINPLPKGIRAETSMGYNTEVNYRRQWDGGSVLINHAFFLTRIQHPIVSAQDAQGFVHFANAGQPVVSKGLDTYLQLHLGGWELYGGYTYTIAQRKYLAQNQFMPLTPKHRAAFILAYDWEKVGRFALEGSYSGRQYRYDGTRTPGYPFIAAMIGKEIGKQLTLVLNCENLFDYRQTRKESIYTGSITNPQFKALWAPIDGRAVNLSLRWNWAKKA